MNKRSDLSKFNNQNYNPGNIIVRSLWYLVNILFFKSSLFPIYFLKVSLLKLFGAHLGKGVIIKPNVNIKYPWKLKLGNNVWIGENVWIDNLELVSIGNNVCISQGAVLICGNHNYKALSFDLITQPISLKDGVWIGAKSMVLPGIIAENHAILCAGSVISKNLDSHGIYKGNPALKIGTRKIS